MRVTMSVLTALAVPLCAGAAPRALSPADPGWTLRGDVRVERVEGVPAFVFRTGQAYFRGVAFEEGTIAFDVATTSRRAFIGLRFRAASEGRFEEIYLRPHKSGLPDAVQYAPAFVNGRSQWQLFHGPGETASATFSHSGWLTVRVVVRGSRAAVLLGRSATPVMVVDRLAHEPAPGFIGFWSFDDGEVAPGERTTSVANVIVRPGEFDFTFPATVPVEAPPGVVREWQVSEPFVAPPGAVLALPDEAAGGRWHAARPAPDGLLAFDRVVAPPEGARRATTLARTRLTTESPRTVRIDFGFSDDVSVFLNGVLLYSGVNGYSYNFPRRDGLITPDQASLYLALRPGDNELIFAVSDAFGGWGLMARVR